MMEYNYEKECEELISAFKAISDGLFEPPIDLELREYQAYYKIGLLLGEMSFMKVFLKPLEPKALKLAVRQLIYRVLSELNGLELPYGLLLGIRPEKLLRTLIRETGSKDMGVYLMNKLYFVSEDMLSRLLSIFEIQRPYLEGTELSRQSLYLCLPFCPSRCYYCSFPSNDINKKFEYVKPYLAALKREFRVKIEERLKQDSQFLAKLDVLYIGGGTPSALAVEDLRSLFSYMEGYIDFSGLREFCFEAGRVDTLSPELFELLRGYGVNRLSINPQTMKSESLKLLGRRHGLEEVREAFQLARSYGFDNINSDLILGLRNEGIEDMEESLRRLMELEPENITLHSLAIKKGSDYALSLGFGLSDSYSETGLMSRTMKTSPLLAMQKRMILSLLKEGYRPYYLYRQKHITGGLDNIGFAKKGYECLYNIRIMEEEHEVLGLGTGASSKLKKGEGHVNLRNPKDLETYISKYLQDS